VSGCCCAQGAQGRQGAQGATGPSTAINATAVTTNASFFPVFVAAAGSNQTASVKSAATAFSFNPSTGNLEVGGTVTAASDEKLKTNINNIENALEKVLSLRGVEFNYIEHGGKSIGFIAQEVEKVIPELVFGDDPKSVAYQNFVAILVEAIKELNQKVDRLTNNQV
jgi:plastocyanin